MSYDRYINSKYREGSLLSVPCVALCILLFMILGFLPALPSSITQLFRPAMLILNFVFPPVYYYRLGITHKALILYLVYFLLVFFMHPITRDSAMAYGAVFLFGAFFIVLTMRPWNRREIQMILFTAAIAGAVFAVILYNENPDMLHERRYGGFLFRENQVNDNTASYTLVPGFLCSLALLLFHKPRSERRRGWNAAVRIALLASTVLSAYVLFCIGARSAFFSAALGSVCICFQKAYSYRTVDARWRARISVILLLIVLFVIGMHVTEGTHSSRLFDFENYTDTNGRDELADEAWPMIHKKPFFGGGYDYWNQEGGSELGTHNTFLTIMVRGGYAGALTLFLFLLAFMYEVLPTRNLLLLSFLIETVFHSLAESDLDYFSYIPLLIVFILLRYSSTHKCTVESIL